MHLSDLLGALSALLGPAENSLPFKSMHLGSIHSTALIWEERENGLKEEASYMEWSRVRCDKNWVDVHL